MSELPAKIQGVVADPIQFISRLKIMHKQRQRLTDFSMNKPQKELLEILKTENRVIILKARQMGISTLTRGYHFWRAYTSDQPTQYAVISHTRASAEELHRMEKTFYGASKYTGAGLSSWDTASVTTLQGSFNSASSFAGIGLWRRDVAKTTIIDANTLTGTKLDDCTKKRIASAWKFNDAFDATGTPALWTALVCPRRDDSRLNDAQIIL